MPSHSDSAIDSRAKLTQKPAHADETVRSAERLNEQGRYDAADELLRGEMAARPQNQELMEKYIALATVRGDWRGVRERAEIARARFPRGDAGHRQGITAAFELERFDEATALQRAAEQQFPKRLWPLLEGAKLAEFCEGPAEVERYFKRAMEEYPQNVRGALDHARYLKRVGRLEAAEAAVRQARVRFPADVNLAVLDAEIVGGMGKWELADQRWTAARTSFPDNRQIAIRHAEAPLESIRDKRWDVALARLRALVFPGPAFPGAIQSYAALLRATGQLDAALQFASTSVNQLRRSGHHLSVAVELARIKEARGDHDEALSTLRQLVEQAPQVLDLPIALSQALSRREMWEEADAVCERTIATFKYRVELHAEYARLATMRQDDVAALKRWTAAAELSPRNWDVRLGLYRTRLSLAQDDDEAAASLGPTTGENPMAQIMNRFESLGGDFGGGCEFGLVQRFFRAEPIGLLRWASNTPESLTEALAKRFEGLGDPDQTAIELPNIADGRVQYFAVDRVFDMTFHTFVNQGEMSEEKLHEQWCKRLRYLRRKFIDDLEHSEKIFLYRPPTRLDEGQIERLDAAMSLYGSCKILLIQLADEGHPNGAITTKLPNLMVGYIDQLNIMENGEARRPNHASWMRLCVDAVALCSRAT